MSFIKIFWEKLKIKKIKRKPITDEVIVTKASTQFTKNIIIITPINKVIALTKLEIVELKVCEMVSTSFVILDKISPLVVVSK